MEEEEENLYGDINDGVFGHKQFVYQSNKDDYRTPSQGKINKQNDDDGGKVPYYCTPEYLNSFKGDWNDPIKVLEVSDEKAVTDLDTNEISSHGSGHYNGVDEQVEKGLGERKRTASRAVKCPFVVVKSIKRAKRYAKAKLFNKVDGKKTSANVDVIKASVMFLRASKDERYMIPTWRVKWLLEYRKDKNLNGNEYEKVSNSNEPVNRCLNEYFKAPKAYMALNKDNTHWVTVVMHKKKEIGADIAEANATASVQYPDVSTWPIKTYDMPQQEDG
ncbi:hypothetical protein D1007_03203 [Hordeum vulgare]|nr:hypothetical protein D1007_03203 [Hordeum vulgare]